MPDTKNLKVVELVPGATDGVTQLNIALTKIDAAVGEFKGVALTASPHVLLDAESYHAATINFTGSPGITVTVEFPAGTGRPWRVINSTADDSLILLKVAGSLATPLNLGPGSTVLVVSDETDLLEGESRVYDISSFYNGSPGNGEVIFKMRFARRVTFLENFAGSKGVPVTVADANADFDIKRNGVKVGIMQFGTGASTPNFSDDLGGPITFEEDDVMDIQAPGSADATLANFGFTLAGVRE